MNDFKSSPLSRLSKLSKSIVKASASLAVDVAKNKAQEIISNNKELKDLTYKANAAKEIIMAMSELKGALMKLGQMISITEDMILPKEISDMFKELQKNAIAMSDEDIDSVFMKNFNKRPEDIFYQFERKAIAAASIGQVHIAYLEDGTKLAVKIQYPKIVEAIRSDLKNIHKINKLVTALFPDRPDIDNFIDELKETLLNECDYSHEALQMKQFKTLFENEIPEVHIPKVFDLYSTSEILTMEFAEGLHFDEILNFSAEEKNKIGEIVYKIHQCSLWKANEIHSDPQHGNFLFNKNQVIMLDFGSTRKFDKHFLIDYCALFYATETDNFELFKKAGHELGFFNTNDPDELYQNHFQLIKDIYSPYLKGGTYAVTDLNPLALIGAFIKGVDLKGRKAPKSEFLHLDRSNLGLYSKLKGLKAEVNWEYWRDHFRKELLEEVKLKYQL